MWEYLLQVHKLSQIISNNIFLNKNIHYSFTNY